MDTVEHFFEEVNKAYADNGNVWVRGLLVDSIRYHFKGIHSTVDMTVSMTEDLPSRPTREQVVNLIVEYTPLTRAQVEANIVSPFSSPKNNGTVCCIS